MPYTWIPASWGARLKKARLHKGWSILRLARNSKISAKFINRVERATGEVRCQDAKWLTLLGACGLQEEWWTSVHQMSDADQQRPPISTRTDVFLASGMESLKEQYADQRDATLDVATLLRVEFGLTVFYAGEERPTQKEFEDEGWALRDNIAMLDSAVRIIVIYPPPIAGQTKPLASSILVELGYAIARGLPIFLFFTESRDTLPFLLRSADSILPDCQVVRYRNLEDILTALRARPEWLAAARSK